MASTCYSVVLFSLICLLHLFLQIIRKGFYQTKHVEHKGQVFLISFFPLFFFLPTLIMGFALPNFGHSKVRSFCINWVLDHFQANSAQKKKCVKNGIFFFSLICFVVFEENVIVLSDGQS